MAALMDGGTVIEVSALTFCSHHLPCPAVLPLSIMQCRAGFHWGAGWRSAAPAACPWLTCSRGLCKGICTTAVLPPGTCCQGCQKSGLSEVSVQNIAEQQGCYFYCPPRKQVVQSGMLLARTGEKKIKSLLRDLGLFDAGHVQSE